MSPKTTTIDAAFALWTALKSDPQSTETERKEARYLLNTLMGRCGMAHLSMAQLAAVIADRN